jgi:hypothetical protein
MARPIKVMISVSAVSVTATSAVSSIAAVKTEHRLLYISAASSRDPSVNLCPKTDYSERSSSSFI